MCRSGAAPNRGVTPCYAVGEPMGMATGLVMVTLRLRNFQLVFMVKSVGEFSAGEVVVEFWWVIFVSGLKT